MCFVHLFFAECVSVSGGMMDELKRISTLPCFIREVLAASHAMPEADNENLRLSPFCDVRRQRLVVVYRRFRIACAP
jgi:hypothetical protein